MNLVENTNHHHIFLAFSGVGWDSDILVLEFGYALARPENLVSLGLDQTSLGLSFIFLGQTLGFTNPLFERISDSQESLAANA